MQWSPDSAIYKQLADKISDYIMQGIYKDGDILPSVRQISSEYEINHITVSKAYQTLVDLEVIEMKRGRGMYILEGGTGILKQYKKTQFLEITLPDIVKQMSILKLSEQEIMTAIQDIQSKNHHSNKETL
ncbi:MAG: GntR family transcriptional regulator [Saccharospirillaceae bacterium]|nr:GntR family transcriptional regulator [Pseudomonadales bacterium]NRB80105.1 GntR family transcriptional regulator [Saccharospirillaceae bacterium]